MNTYNIIEPFKYSKKERGFYSGILGAIFVLIVLITVHYSIDSIICLAFFVIFIISVGIFEKKVLYHTQIIGHISFTGNTVMTENKSFNLIDKIQIHLRNQYIAPRAISNCKSSYILEIIDVDGYSNNFLISAVQKKGSIHIFDLLAELKRQSPEFNQKIKIHASY